MKLLNFQAKKIIKWNGKEIGLEYFPGDARFAGMPHERTLKSGYGHIRNHVGADGEALDCYISPAMIANPDGKNLVYEVSQTHPDGQFDEQKYMLGYNSQDEAQKAYLAEMPKNRFGEIKPVDLNHISIFKKPPKLQNYSESNIEKKYESLSYTEKPQFKKAVILNILNANYGGKINNLLIDTVPFNGAIVSGRFETPRIGGNPLIMAYSITKNSCILSPQNLEVLDNSEGEFALRHTIALAFSENYIPLEYYDFAQQELKCEKGWSCRGKNGYTCLSKTKKNCNNALSDEHKTYADWLQHQININPNLHQEHIAEANKLGITKQALILPAQTTTKSLSTLKKVKLSKTLPKPPKPGTVAEVDVNSLTTDPTRFQYKIVHGASGSSGSLTGVQKFDPNLAGIIQVWRDPADNKDYIVNGHNRAELAKKLNAGKVTVRYLDVRDAKEARAVGALTNIAEGRGNALDAAKFFRDTGISRQDLQKKGIPLKEKIATDGVGLSQLNDALFNRVVHGSIPVERAVIIGASGLDHQQQQSLSDLIDSSEKKGRKITNDVLKELTDTVKNSHQSQQFQLDLFGGSSVQIDNALERSQLQSDIKKKLSREKKLFGIVSKSKAAQDLQKAGNVIDPDASGKISKNAALTLIAFDQFKNLSGPISDAINTATTKIQAGDNRKKVQDDLYNEIVTALPNMLAQHKLKLD